MGTCEWGPPRPYNLNMEPLSGKIAIVTGGTRGIGRAIAERLLREGASVAICGRSSESVERAVREMQPLGRIAGHAADVTQAEQVGEFFQAVDREFGGLDILVNNAGEGVFRKVAEMTPEEWHRNIDLNLNGPFYCSREALARFAKRGGGFIVNISSLAGKNAVQRRRGLQRIEVRTQRFQRSHDAGPPLRQRSGQLHHAGKRGHGVLTATPPSAPATQAG